MKKQSDKFMYQSENVRNKLQIVAKRIWPMCPIYKEGYKMTIVEPGIVVEETDAICLSFLADLIPYYRGLCRGIDPKKMGLRTEGDKAYIECHDPGGKYPDFPTDGGTVLFEIRRIPINLKDLQEYRKFDMEEMEKVWADRRKNYQAKHKE
jgi:uncharacterized repeat protein (TIGR04076 family)